MNKNETLQPFTMLHLEVNGTAEPLIDLIIGDRHLCHYIDGKSGTTYFLDDGIYEVELTIRKTKKPTKDTPFIKVNIAGLGD